MAERRDPQHAPLTRRRVIAGLGAGAVSLAAARAFAQGGEDPLQQLMQQNERGDFGQNFDSTSRTIKMPKTSLPTLSAATAQTTEAAVARYEQIVASGGWPHIPPADRLRLGGRHPSVVPLRTRLKLSGDLDPGAGEGEVYDFYVELAVRRFQARHGISGDGIARTITFAALNIPAGERLNQLKANLTRLRAFAATPPHRHVVCNIPAAQLEAIENGVVMSRHAAVAGKPDRPSPDLTSKIVEINFNPFWTVPVSIVRKDLIPRMQTEPDYLTKNHIRILDPKGQELAPGQVNWFSEEAVNYRFKQDPGDFNSLGSIRINFPSTARRLYARHAAEEPVRRGHPLPLVRLHAHPERARAGQLASVGDQRLVARRDRRGHQVGRAQGRQAQAAGAAAVGLHHRLGDARRHRAIPRRHLQSRWAESGADAVARLGARRSAGAVVSDWYIFIDGQARGPGTTDDLIAYLHKNDPARTRIWREGFDGWVLARDVPEVAAALAAAPIPQAEPSQPPAAGQPGRPPSPASAPASVPSVPQAAASAGPQPAQPQRRRRALAWIKYGAALGVVYSIVQLASGAGRGEGASYIAGYLLGGALIGTVIAVIAGFIADLVGGRGHSPVAPIPSALPRGGNFIVRHWRGEYKLWFAYWIVVFAGNLAAAVVIGVIVATVRFKGGYYPLGIFATFIAIWSCVLVVSVWQFVGVWRSARRYKQERLAAGRFRFWGYVAQVVVLLGTLGAITTFARDGAPQIREAYRMAFANDPGIPDYTVRVMRNGAELEITGGIKYGLTDEVLKIFAGPNGIKVVHLTSYGGRLGEAQRLYEAIRDRGLSTYVSLRCMSACTLAFAGGRERYLRKGATLGFHRGAFPGVKERDLDDVQADVFRQAGFDSAFIRTALSTPNTSMYKPSEDVLLKARVVTRVGAP